MTSFGGWAIYTLYTNHIEFFARNFLQGIPQKICIQLLCRVQAKEEEEQMTWPSTVQFGT